MMKFAVVILACVAAASARLTVPYPVVPFGIVEDVLDCGSAGILQFVAVTDCTKSPCELVPGRNYEIDVVFIASRNAAQLTLNIRVRLSNNEEHLVASVPVEGRIVGGEQFTISFVYPVTGQFSGQSLLITFELIDEGDGRKEVCATAGANVA